MPEFKAHFKSEQPDLGGSLPGRLIFGIPGKDGGYYLVAAEQVDANTIRFTFTPSQKEMPKVDPVDIELPGATDERIEEAIKEYLQNNPAIGKPGEPGFSPIAKVVQTDDGAVITITDKDGTTEVVITNGKNGYTPKKGIDYDDGKSAYEYAKEGGYTGTETEFSEKLAKEYPEKVSQLENDSQYINAAGAPVQSINGQTGKVHLGAADVGARPFSWMPSAQEVGALPDTYVPPNQTAAQVGADPAGTAAAAVSTHNTSTDSHGDLRLELKAINDRLAAFFDSDNQTLDELSEIVAYITSNKELIDSITTSKVNVSDIVDNLTTNVANKPLSAAQGVVIKGLIDALTIPTKLSQLINDKGYISDYTETDPTVPAWAKASSKPSYTKSEVGLGDVDNVRQYSASNPPPYPVTSVNGKTGDIYVPSDTVLYTAQSLTDAQKAQARANIGATAGEEVEYAESVEWLDTNGDTEKKYVLPDGYIYEYTEKFVTEKHEANNANALINQKVNTRGDYNTVSAQSGVLTSDIIKFSSAWPSLSAADRPKTTVTISGLEKLVPAYNDYSLWVFYYKADGSFLGAANSAQMESISAASGAEISLPKSFYLKDPNYAPSGGWSNVGYVRLVLGISTTGDIAAEDVAALRINCPYYDFEGTRAGWYSTGRQHSNDKATQQNSADIAALKERTDALEAGITELRETMDNNGLTRAQTGEVLYAVGDSITYGTNVGGNSGSWVRHVIDTNGYDAANSKNLGISGIGFCTEASSKTVRTVVDENDFSAADIVTVAIGVNDWKNYNATLESFFSEMEYCLTKIRADNPYCRIFYILPFNWRPSSSSFETFYALGYAGDSNPERPYGNTLQTFVNMIKEKLDEEPLKALDVHVIDMTKTPAITRYNIETALSDGLHPTAECHEALAREIARRIAFA